MNKTLSPFVRKVAIGVVNRTVVGWFDWFVRIKLAFGSVRGTTFIGRQLTDAGDCVPVDLMTDSMRKLIFQLQLSARQLQAHTSHL
jgi:hypothetical protein